MKITINGHTKDIPGAGNITSLIAQFGGQGKKIIAELNGAIIPAGDWDKTTLKEGDAVELVAFVGGG